MFNNCDYNTNGECAFFERIKANVSVIFDVGCQSSHFTSFVGEVHYFDPVSHFIDDLENQSNSNKLSFFNKFGLGSENKELYYYPAYQSFYDRINSCKISDEPNKVLLRIGTAKDYITENNINQIDFIKIDTEGFEMDVLKGFGDFLKNIKIIQFEYGGTFLDNNIKLIELVNYLTDNGFESFSYLTSNGIDPITDFSDHYQYCNIVCKNKTSDVNL